MNDRPSNSRSFKRKARARMAEPGQNYTSARRDLQAEHAAMAGQACHVAIDLQTPAPVPETRVAGAGVTHVTFSAPGGPRS